MRCCEVRAGLFKWHLDRESSFHHCGGAVKLLACLCMVKTLQPRFNRRGGAVKHVQSCLYAGKTLQRRLNRTGGAVKHLQDCLCAPLRCCEGCAGLFKWH